MLLMFSYLFLNTLYIIDFSLCALQYNGLMSEIYKKYMQQTHYAISFISQKFCTSIA